MATSGIIKIGKELSRQNSFPWPKNALKPLIVLEVVHFQTQTNSWGTNKIRQGFFLHFYNSRILKCKTKTGMFIISLYLIIFYFD